uniref:Uncharacterized protein n=1 Tax=Avena sativa TaxID=4498 RepID=A0ACD5XJ78_AVESA
MAPSQTRSRRGRPAGIAERPPISFLSGVGRVLFVSTFLLSSYKHYRGMAEFGSDGPAVKCLEPKFNLFVKQVSTNTGMALPHIEIVFWATYYLRIFGSALLVFCSSGAFLLILYLAFITPVMYDFYNYEMGSPDFIQLSTQFSQNLALCGALLFFMGMKNSIPRRHLGNSKRKVAKTKIA